MPCTDHELSLEPLCSMGASTLSGTRSASPPALGETGAARARLRSGQRSSIWLSVMTRAPGMPHDPRAIKTTPATIVSTDRVIIDRFRDSPVRPYEAVTLYLIAVPAATHICVRNSVQQSSATGRAP